MSVRQSNICATQMPHVETQWDLITANVKKGLVVMDTTVHVSSISIHTDMIYYTDFIHVSTANLNTSISSCLSTIMSQWWRMY